jgi:hypothetical protein
LGPFTGGQLTVIILGITLAIAFPIGAWAVTGSNVFVTDATSGKTAKVDATGHVLSKVSGAVVAVTRPADYSQWKRYSISVNSSGCAVLATPTNGNAVVIVSLSVDYWYNPSAETTDYGMLSTGTSCIGGFDFISAPPGGIGHVSIPYEPGLISTTGFSITRVAGDAYFTVTATGYEIPTSSLP